MNIQEKIKATVDNIIQFKDWEDKYAAIIKLGKEMPSMPEEFRVDGNKVSGCQSQVWLYPDMSSSLDKVLFYADSDALIAKGLIALVLQVYNSSSAQEIMTTAPNFIQDMGLDSHLSPNRANGLQAMIKQIKLYAYALSVKAGQV